MKIKECKKPVIEAYISTLIERAFYNDADIRFCRRSEPLTLSGEGLFQPKSPVLVTTFSAPAAMIKGMKWPEEGGKVCKGSGGGCVS